MDDESEQPDAGNDLQRSADDYTRDARPPPVEILEMEFVYEALAHPRRRYLCYSLLSSSHWTLTELATKLVAWERDIPEEDVDEVNRNEMYVSLYHAHVPKLVELDIVEYENGGEKVVVADTNAPQVLAALEGAGASIDASQETHAQNDYEQE
ncbi:DUF7344 domain-containing protein [Natronococcus jeotgali]|uniref:DUF7344 domain-containing protein n=1 Tax=Natronococcus jeotgali DSM 18795 TaxID=1227498 RepID=L9XYN1_9EURY|nr:hypothetical protein [Natronococcus jeotgali]ELY66516.1 hypothetical protein C492_01289 [Natronococcus jeotgali DSM 18795]